MFFSGGKVEPASQSASRRFAPRENFSRIERGLRYNPPA
jgi:hypothetical protein